MGQATGDSDAETERLAQTVDRLAPLIDTADRLLSAPTQRVEHTYPGAGGLLGAAITACFCTLFVTLFVYFVVNDKMNREIDRLERQRKEDVDTMRDQKAWIEILRGKVATLEARAAQQQQESSK